MSVAAAAVVVGRREGGRRCGCEVWGVGEYRDVGVGEGQEPCGGYRHLELKVLGKGSEYSCAGHEAAGAAGFHLHAATDGRTRLLQKSKSRQKQRVYLPAGRITAWSWGSGGVGRSRENRSWE